ARQFVSNRRAIQQIAPTGCQVVLALFFNKLRYASRFNLAAVFIQRAVWYNGSILAKDERLSLPWSWNGRS
ncbi:MAG: hypothetical protein OXE52_19640, partial [Chloroflexi bacterium]|nr:hypothetical protein [Chloroflexota bacterium]